MKYIHTIALLTALLLSLIACSPDIEEDEAVVTEEEQTPSSEWPDWVPHWWDGTITVRTGVYETGKEMQEDIDNQELCHPYDADLRMLVRKIPTSKIPGETEVTVLTLREAGMTGASTIEEIRSHFGVEGYRPLTLEEAVMTRLDFTDQPKASETVHKKMTEFYTLLSQKDGLFLGWERSEWTFRIGRYASLELFRQGNQIFSDRITDKKFHLETAFACVKKIP